MFTASHYQSSHHLTKSTALLPTLAAPAPTLPACTDIRGEEPTAATLQPLEKFQASHAIIARLKHGKMQGLHKSAIALQH